MYKYTTDKGKNIQEGQLTACVCQIVSTLFCSTPRKFKFKIKVQKRFRISNCIIKCIAAEKAEVAERIK